MSKKPSYEELEKRIYELEQVESERDRVLEALQQSEERLNLVIKGSNDSAWYWDLVTNERYYSPQWWNQLGYEPNELPIDTALWERLVHPEDAAHVDSVFKAALNSDIESYEVEFRLLHKNGHYVPVLSRGFISKNASGEPIRVTGTNLDLTESRKAEKLLRQSERKLKFTLDAIPFPVAVVDLKDDRIIYWSSSALELFGHTAPTVSDWYQLAYPDPDYRQDVIKRWKPFLKKAQTSGHPVNAGEYQVTCKDKSTRICELYVCFISDSLIVTFNDITDQKRVEDALKKSEDLFRKLSENATDMIYRMSLHDGIYEYVSPASVDIFGYRPEEFYNTPLLIKSLIHPDWHGYFEKEWGKLLQGKNPPIYEYQVIHKDKGIRWVNQRNSLEKDTKGNPAAIVGVVTDITEKKIAKEELVKSRSHLRILVDTIPDLVWLKDVDGVYLSCNSMFEKMFGAKEASIVGRTDYDFVDKDLADFFREHDRKAMRLDKPSINEEWLTFADNGYSGLFETIKTPMKGPDGKLIGVLGIARDITKRKQTEESLKETERKLLEAQKMANLGFWIWDVKSGEVEWSDEVYKIFQLDPKEFTPQIDSIQELSPWPEDNKRDVELIHRATENKEPGSYEQKFLFPDGSIGHYHSTFQGVYDDRGNLTAIKGTVQGITEKKKADEEQKRLEEQLQQAQKMEAIGTLAGGIAHEFNNVLAIIMGNNELIMEELPQYSLARESTEEIRIAGLRARDVVKQLLTFTRQDDAVKKVVDIRAVVQESMKLIRSTTPTNIKIEQNVSADTFPILGNDTQINQILINLCNNAIDAMPEKGGKITVELSNETIEKEQTKHQTTLKPGQYAKLLVNDNGIGMDNETINRVFEPYFTTKDVGKGSGIGMAVVHGIIERYNGVIIVDSNPGQGTAFTIFFPAYEGSLKEEIENKNDLPTGKECILYVDDETSIALLGKRRLESLGYRTESTSDPLKALEMVKSDPHRFDLVITDMAMPNMTGDQLIVEILKIRQDIPTIICTGYSATISDKKAKEMGVSAFAMKPLAKSDLATKVRKVLDEAKNKM